MANEPRWWGWGDDAHAGAPPQTGMRFLAEQLGGLGALRPAVALDAVRLGESRLPAPLRERFAAILRDDRLARILHAHGKSYPDLVRQRAGDAQDAPDAVLAPRDHDETAAVLRACARSGVAVVPFGGGTSVVGGVEPLRGDHDALVALDLHALGTLEQLDERSQLAVAGGGMRVAALEARLAARGLTLGHFPQSYEYVTVGGCAATRSAGQASTGYGRFEALVRGLRLAAPAGDLVAAAHPASAAGPALRELVVGSEGALGAITQVSLRVRRAPEQRRYEGWMLPGFAVGCEVLRELAQAGLAPDVARLSDDSETRFNLAMSGRDRGAAGRVLGGYLRLRHIEAGALLIAGWEGSPPAVATRRAAAAQALRAGGGVALGRGAGLAWERSRYHGPYVRDHLMDRGVLVDTLETAASWTALGGVHEAVAAALRAHAPLVGCHVSHLYPTGASLYFTLLARARLGAELEQWHAVKRAAGDAIIAAGATITHHHAVGADHAPWLEAEIGERGIAGLRALKAELDPAGVMNPGKLLAPA